MMRKAAYLLFTILLLSFLFGCMNHTEDLEQPVPFFYPEKVQNDGSVNNVISFENWEGKTFNEDLNLLLSVYLNGPKDHALYSPFPANTKLIDVTVSENIVTLRFNETFAQLSGLERTIACAAISRTCMAYTGASSVEIFAENTLFNGDESIVISADNLMTEDNTPIKEP